MILVGDWAIGNSAVHFNIDPGYYIINLEGPIVEAALYNGAPKVGPRISNQAVPAIPNSNVTCVLANNHIMDFGVVGLDSTFCILKENGIKYTGAGLNNKQASKPIIVIEQDRKIGIISCCEGQFGIATETIPGVNEFDPRIYAQITNFKKNVDFLIVSVHAGLENMPLPSPYIRELYKSYIDAGADIIHGHHSHIPQGYEKYKGKSIYYGLGNFVAPFENWAHNKNATWSYGIKLDFGHPILQETIQFFKLTEGIDRETIVEYAPLQLLHQYNDYLQKVNSVLYDESFYTSVWHTIALYCYEEYGLKYLLSPLKHIPGLKKQLLHRIQSTQWQLNISENSFLLLKHLFSCESHRQMLITALAISGKEIKDQSNQASKEWLNSILK